MIAFVRGVMQASMPAGLIWRSASTSANTGTAPTDTTALAQPTNVAGGRITSSPGPTPSARRATMREAVPELTPRA